MLILTACCFWSLQTLPTVNEIIKNVPADLISETLLLPRFAEYTLETMPEGMPESFLAINNREAKRCNEIMLEMARKYYPFEIKLVNLTEVDDYREEGFRYYVDMALMPKQMTAFKKEVMVPSYRKYASAQHMFTNQYTQVQYYFYIRDLNNQNAFVSTKLKGHDEVFAGIGKFLKQINKDLKE